MQTKSITKSLIASALIALLFSCTQESNNQDKAANTNPDSLKNSTKVTADSVLQFTQVNYPNGQIKMEGNMQYGLREGKWVSFYENGMIWSETHFLKGQKNGPTTTWFPNGNKRYTGEFKNDNEFGTWIYYYENGKVAQEKTYQ